MKKLQKQSWLRGTRWAVVLLSLALILTACTPSNTVPIGNVVDDLGRSVNIETIPQRIVSLAPSNTENLFALGLEEKVVGVTEHCNYPPEALDKEKVGGFSTPDIEKIVALQPDLILASDIHKEEIIPALEEKGLTVFALVPENLDGILKDIQILGKITGKEEEASELEQEIMDKGHIESEDIMPIVTEALKEKVETKEEAKATIDLAQEIYDEVTKG